MCISVSHGRTPPTEAKQFTAGAFLEFLVLAIGIHALTDVDVTDMLAEDIAHRAFKPSASHHFACGQYSHVTVSTVATVVNRVIVQTFRNLEQSFFVKEQCPEMVFKIESSAGILVLLELLPDALQKATVLQRLDVGTLLEAGGAIPPECENIYMMCYDKVYNVRYFIDVRS